MGYRLLGMAVWKLFLRRRLRSMLPSRSLTAAAIVVAAVVGIAFAQNRLAGAE
jgi:hypothetical protein